jgi:hypothetical protein
MTLAVTFAKQRPVNCTVTEIPTAVSADGLICTSLVDNIAALAERENECESYKESDQSSPRLARPAEISHLSPALSRW